MRYRDSGNGVTRDSLKVLRKHRHRLGDVVEASVGSPGLDDPHDSYVMVLRDGAGDAVALSGCSGGDRDERPRGTAGSSSSPGGWRSRLGRCLAWELTLQRDARPPLEAARGRARHATGRHHGTGPSRPHRPCAGATVTSPEDAR